MPQQVHFKTGNMRSSDSRSRAAVLGLVLFFLSCSILPVWSVQNLTTNFRLNVGMTLVSPSGQFELGIFPLGVQTFYLCIRYAAPIQNTVVWVANRDSPLSQSGAYLQLSSHGILQLFDETSPADSPVWNTSSTPTNATVARLMDTGNLVLQDNETQILWNSFNSSVTDTLLPGQYLYRVGDNPNALTSWLSGDNPGTGNYTFGWGAANVTCGTNVSNVVSLQLACQTCETTNGIGKVYIPAPDVDCPHVISNVDSVYFHPYLGGLYIPPDPNVTRLPPAPTVIFSDFQQPSIANTLLKRLTLDTDGGLRIWEWTLGSSKEWTAVANWVVQERGTQCFVLGTCGPFGLCNMIPPASLNPVQCTCPYGFKPQDMNDFSRGCMPVIQLSDSDLESNGSFAMTELDGVDMPWAGDIDSKAVNSATTCQEWCSTDPNCTGVVYSKDEQNCWKKNGLLYNLGYLTVVLHGTSRVSYLKIAKNQPKNPPKAERSWKILGPVLGGIAFVIVIGICVYKFRIVPRICGRGCMRGPDPATPPFGSDRD